MTAGAWYHIDTLTKAAGEYEATIRKLVEELTIQWGTETRDFYVEWYWDRWFSLPYRRKMTLDELFSSHRLYYSDYRILNPRRVERIIDDMEKHIGLARRSVNNLVYLEARDVNDFGGFLTINHETHEIIFE